MVNGKLREGTFSKSIPLGMHLSVENDIPPTSASHRDASLGTDRGIPTGCHDSFSLFSTERNIPTGCSETSLDPAPQVRNVNNRRWSASGTGGGQTSPISPARAECGIVMKFNFNTEDTEIDTEEKYMKNFKLILCVQRMKCALCVLCVKKWHNTPRGGLLSA